MDIIITFLNRKIDIKLYIDQSTKYNKKGKIYKIFHTFYSLKQLGNI